VAVTEGPAIRLEPWTDDLPLLRQLLGDATMTAHVGGPETDDKIAERNERYGRPGSRQSRIVDAASGEGVGWVGYWELDWQGQPVYEMGWFVVPAFQGRGIATAAARMVIEQARAERGRRFIHAFPGVDNEASNAICRKAGLDLVGPVTVEYPPGHAMTCNDWRLDLVEGTGPDLVVA
jgi:RimJ/RimL family protein N-acetyltransferase